MFDNHNSTLPTAVYQALKEAIDAVNANYQEGKDPAAALAPRPLTQSRPSTPLLASVVRVATLQRKKEEEEKEKKEQQGGSNGIKGTPAIGEEREAEKEGDAAGDIVVDAAQAGKQ